MFVLFRYELRGTLHVTSKLDWDRWLNFNSEGDSSGKYTLLAEHHDKGVLEKMKQLALEGDRDGNE